MIVVNYIVLIAAIILSFKMKPDELKVTGLWLTVGYLFISFLAYVYYMMDRHGHPFAEALGFFLGSVSSPLLVIFIAFLVKNKQSVA